MLKQHEVNGYLYDGVKFDCGSKEGYVQAIAHLASDFLSK
jgi:UTP-glucose-1-phosphate uridylyltransferase